MSSSSASEAALAAVVGLADAQSPTPTHDGASGAAATSMPCHVVVVGAGLAGLAAALSAAESGARVTIFEKEKSIGGNSAKATSGMNAVGTPAQAAAGVLDSQSLFFADTMSSGHKLSDPTLVRTLAAGSPDAVEWLRAKGVSLDAVTLCGGHSVARTHHEAPRADGKPTPVGWDIIAALRKAVEARPDAIAFRTSVRVVELLQDTRGWTPDRPRGQCPIVGVRIVSTTGASVSTGVRTPVAAPSSEDVACDAVVLTTGGFGNDHTPTSLLSQYAPQLSCLPTTNGAFAQGDGVKIARAVGAALRGMDHVQVHPTGIVDPADPRNTTKFLGPEALRGVGGILLNHRGRRFTNELGRRDEVTHAMYQWCTTQDATESAMERGDEVRPAPVVAYIVLTPSAAERFGPNFNFYFKVKHFFREVDGAAGLAAEIGATATAEDVAKTLTEYAEAATRGSDKYGKTAFIDPFTDAVSSRLYVARVTPSIHYTMGGVATNAAGELLYADASEVERQVLMDAAAGYSSTSATPARTPVSMDATPHAEFSYEDRVFDLTATKSSIDLRKTIEAESHEFVVGLDETAGLFERPIMCPIPRLFGAGEVTGGVHGANRLAGNSLLECAVYGRIAGARAAAVQRASEPALRPDEFVPLRFRESYKVGNSVFLFRFDLPSPLHTSGLAVGEYISVRAVLDGKETVRFYSPISRSDACGHLDLLLKIDASGGAMTTHINSLRPGQTLDFKGPMGGVKIDLRPGGNLGRVKKIGLVCGGTGLAPMAQILRSAFHYGRDDIPIRMLYAAAAPNQLAYLPLLRRKSRLHPNFQLRCAVEKVPAGVEWNESVGYINEATISEYMFPPSEDLLIVMCGPYPMCQALKKVFAKMGYVGDMLYSYM